MTISTLVSNVGGFFSLLVMIINYVLFKFQFFKYETSIMKRIYHQDKSLKKRRKTVKAAMLEREVAKTIDKEEREDFN